MKIGQVQNEYWRQLTECLDTVYSSNTLFDIPKGTLLTILAAMHSAASTQSNIDISDRVLAAARLQR